ncbi:glycosyltransferase [Saccharospirillum impatiens]|uniref:glycosyltransferase n=1 Tax=Saccharospirillum impatiens TaxID=169438 RepID=UPI00041A434C|nr:glycosyltransferase [Saccharospirillum impatiens]
MKPIRVSIILACYNAESTILNALSSIKSQTYYNVEVVVIDGKSTDSTARLLEQHESTIDTFISEEDSGIGDAWNKGLKNVTGELVLFHNADDLWHPRLIERYLSVYKANGCQSGIYYGDCYIHKDGLLIKKIVGHHDENRMRKGLGFGFVHTATMVTRDVYKQVGGFSTKLSIAIDTDFLCRCIRNDNIPFIYSGDVGVYMQTGGISDSSAKKAYQEYLEILVNYSYISKKKASFLTNLYFFYSPLRKLIKSNMIYVQLRKSKHLLLHLINFSYNIVPTFFIKNILLKVMGVAVGKNSYILRGAEFFNVGNIIIGSDSIVNRNVVFDNRGTIVIGSGVSISRGCEIHTAGHDIESPMFDYLVRGVNIEDSVVLFSKVSVMPGVTIGRNSVVMANSVVVADVPENTLVGGNPAKIIKTLNRSPLIKFKYPYWYAK